MPYVNKNNGWNSRYACALIRITPIPASAERRFCRDDIYPLSDLNFFAVCGW